MADGKRLKAVLTFDMCTGMEDGDNGDQDRRSGERDGDGRDVTWSKASLDPEAGGVGWMRGSAAGASPLPSHFHFARSRRV